MSTPPFRRRVASGHISEMMLCPHDRNVSTQKSRRPEASASPDEPWRSANPRSLRQASYHVVFDGLTQLYYRIGLLGLLRRRGRAAARWPGPGPGVRRAGVERACPPVLRPWPGRGANRTPARRLGSSRPRPIAAPSPARPAVRAFSTRKKLPARKASVADAALDFLLARGRTRGGRFRPHDATGTLLPRVLRIGSLCAARSDPVFW